MAGETPFDFSGLGEDQDEMLRRELARALAMRKPSGQQYSTPLGALFGGLGDVVGAFRGGRAYDETQARIDALSKRRKAAEEQAPEMFKALPAPMADASLPDEEQTKAFVDALSQRERAAGQLVSSGYGPLSTLGKYQLDEVSKARDRFEQSKLRTALAKKKGEDDKAKTQHDVAEGLRKEFTGNPMVKRTQELAEAWGKMDSAFKSGGPASDMSLIYGFMKMQDPGSTVREGEYATAENSGSVDQRLIGLYNRVLKGERLAPSIRSDFMRQATGLYGAQIERFKPFAETYGGLADRYGVPRENVVLNLGFPQAVAPPQPRGEKVRIQLPNGQTKVIPAEKLGEAIKSFGAKELP